MKRIAILSVIALSAAAAHADPVTVEAPKAPISAEAGQAYVAKLDKAIKEVCHDEVGPLVGVAYFSYKACIQQTRADVAKQDPTGLYAAKRESTGATVIAAR